MCGIAGLVATAGTLGGDAPRLDISQAALDRLAETLAHRGPDGRGFHLRSDTGFAHLRLAIIDLATGDQPLHEPGGATLVGNGEIYNYLELRREMADTAFRTGSDCEPPLHLYRKHGLAFAQHLRGMYALAIHDPAAGRTVLARDPFGIKPLYYAELPGGIAFASEPRALLDAGLVERGAILTKARDELLQLQFTTGSETIFQGIRRVLPGEAIEIAGGQIVGRHRQAALPEGGPVPTDEAGALTAVDAALRDSVAVHCRSDVPYGLFLSGGIDSALVLSYMAEQAREAGGPPVRTYTVGFDDAAADERAAARAIAAACGADPVEVSFGEADFWDLLPKVAEVMDDPAADYACLPTFKLAREAAKDLKVVLTGEGGDEIFGGYGRYRGVMRPWWLGGKVLRGKGIFTQVNVLRRRTSGWRDGVAAAEITEARGGRTRLMTAQAVDCSDWLPNDLLGKLDRCLMANGMEGRTPFLDPVVAGAGFRLPDGLKIRDGRGKYILRRLLAQRVPVADAFGSKKGFTVPVGVWLNRMGDRLGPLLARQPGILDIAEPDRVRALARASGKHEGFALWVLLFYALWHRRHVLGLSNDGPIWDLLAETPHGR